MHKLAFYWVFIHVCNNKTNPHTQAPIHDLGGATFGKPHPCMDGACMGVVYGGVCARVPASETNKTHPIHTHPQVYPYTGGCH